MALYKINRRVWIKDAKRIGYIQRADFYKSLDSNNRRAVYLVDDGAGLPFSYYLPKHLRAADLQCEECNRWLPIGSFNQGYRDECDICYLCMRSFNFMARGPQGWNTNGLKYKYVPYDLYDAAHESAWEWERQ